MIKVTCRLCHQELNSLGGLLISPPDNMAIESLSQVIKSHLCKECYEIVTDFIMDYKREGT